MSLKTFVKISNVSSLSDARYCAGMGVDILGFNIDPTSSAQIDPSDYKEITDWVAGVEFAGEFDLASADEIKSTMKDYPIHYVQVTNLDVVEAVGLLGVPIIFKAQVDSDEDLSRLSTTLSYLDELASIVIVKSENPAMEEKLDEAITFYNGNVKLVMGYQVRPSDSIHKFPGVEMEATREEKPGFKDYGEIMDVLEALDND
ncbi:MAG: hypothetical protein ABJG78_11745 [Cyclobacteriaceae bacterium]